MVLLLAQLNRHAPVFDLLAAFLGFHTANPLANHCLGGFVIGIDIAHKDKREVSRISKTLLVDLQGFVHRYTIQHLHCSQDHTWRVAVSHHLYRVGKGCFGVLVTVDDLVANHIDERLVGLFVLARSREIQIVQLQHSLQILDAA